MPRKVSEQWLGILDADSSPAFLTTMHNHTREIDSLHRIMEKHLPITGPRPPLTNVQIAGKLKDAYDEAGLSEFWGLCEDWLRAQGKIP